MTDRSDIEKLESGIARLEPEAESAIESREDAAEAVARIEDSIARLRDDLALSGILPSNLAERQAELSAADAELEALRSRAKEIESALESISLQNTGSLEVLDQMKAMGENIEEGLTIIKNRQEQIESCKEQLQAILEKLGIAETLDSNMENAAPPESSIERIREGEGFLQGVHAEHLAAGPDYERVLSRRRGDAVPEVRTVFDHFSGKLTIRDASLPADEIPHYAPYASPGHPRGVYYNAAADEHNPRGAGTTYYHELGHMIDHTAGGLAGNLSRTDAFADALRADAQNIIDIFDHMSENAKQSFLRRLEQDDAHSASDLLDALTAGRIAGRYGHTAEYWTYEGNLQAEAFAHFFEASMGGGSKYVLLTTLFPSAFGEFSKMIESLQPDIKKLAYKKVLK